MYGWRLAMQMFLHHQPGSSDVAIYLQDPDRSGFFQLNTDGCFAQVSATGYWGGNVFCQRQPGWSAHAFLLLFFFM